MEVCSGMFPWKSYHTSLTPNLLDIRWSTNCHVGVETGVSKLAKGSGSGAFNSGSCSEFCSVSFCSLLPSPKTVLSSRFRLRSLEAFDLSDEKGVWLGSISTWLRFVLFFFVLGMWASIPAGLLLPPRCAIWWGWWAHPLPRRNPRLCAKCRAVVGHSLIHTCVPDRYDAMVLERRS